MPRAAHGWTPGVSSSQPPARHAVAYRIKIAWEPGIGDMRLDQSAHRKKQAGGPGHGPSLEAGGTDASSLTNEVPSARGSVGPDGAPGSGVRRLFLL